MDQSGRQINLLFFILNLTFILSGCLAIESYASAMSGSLTGTWVANGSRETLSLGDGRVASIFRLAGHVNLRNEVGKESDYWSECIGFADSDTGSSARCSWTAHNGEKIFLVLEGEKLSEGSRVNGKIIGGTGSVSGITGSITFKWSTMSVQTVNDDTVIGGYAKELSGTYEIP